MWPEGRRIYSPLQSPVLLATHEIPFPKTRTLTESSAKRLQVFLEMVGTTGLEPVTYAL